MLRSSAARVRARPLSSRYVAPLLSNGAPSAVQILSSSLALQPASLFRSFVTKPKFDNIPLSRVRNVGIIAHIDAGKTTTTERMLYYAGMIRSVGDVDDGDTVMDHMKQEQERGITITAAAISFPWKDHRVNLIDTPGHVDFTIEVERSMRVLDGAIAIFDAVSGVEAQSRTVWRQADRYGVPVVALINKMDRPGAGIQTTLQSMKDKLGANPLLIQWPIFAKDDSGLESVIDLLTMERIDWVDKFGKTVQRIPISSPTANVAPEIIEKATRARENLIEKVADVDEQVADLYLGGEEVSTEILKSALRRITLTRKGVPVLCAASLKHKGVQGALDSIVEYLPSPAERPAAKAEVIGKNQKVAAAVQSQQLQSKGKEEAAVAKKEDEDEKKKFVERKPLESDPLCALAFKVVHDQQRGPLVYVRVYSGVLSSRDLLTNTSRAEKERPQKLLQMFSNESEEVQQIGAGGIGAIVGLKHTCTGDTLIKDRDAQPVLLEGLQVPRPVFMSTIEPESSSDQKPLEEALAALQREDPTFQVHTDPETGQLVISGMGELHLEILHDRIVRDFKVAATRGKIQIAYKETISTPIVEMEHTYEGSAQGGTKFTAASLRLRLEPAANRGDGNSFHVALEPAHCHSPSELLRSASAAVRQGVLDGLTRGVLLAYPMEDIAVTMIGGELSSSSSSASNSSSSSSSISELDQAAFRACASQLIAKAAEAGAPRLLEPTMEVEITTDDKYMGSVLSDLTGVRRAAVRDIEFRAIGSSEDSQLGERVIFAEVPLREMIGYSTSLRSITQGNAGFSMSFSRYEEVGDQEQEKILKDIRGY